MEIKYLGHASFLIKSHTAELVTDPFDPQMVGFKFPKTEADVVTISHHHGDHDAVSQVDGSPLVIDMPGEYERLGFRIFGFRCFHDKEQGKQRGENIIFKIESEGISLLHCGDLGHLLDEALIDQLGEINILMVPVGGFYTIDYKEAVALSRKIEPEIIIPMHYRTDKHDPSVFEKITPVSDFLKEINQEIEPQDKLVVKKEDLSEMEMQVVVLNPFD
jgi:L-ascorbate metabolism protein UlaG (beta-lactamase superfamily)